MVADISVVTFHLILMKFGVLMRILSLRVLVWLWDCHVVSMQ